jgi:hypothetical protein
MYEPFASPLDRDGHVFVVLAEKAAKAGIDERENDDGKERGEGVIPIMRELVKNERHTHTAERFRGPWRCTVLRYIYNPSEFEFFLSPPSSLPSSTMSESLFPSCRPSVYPTPSRDPPSPPTSRPAASLLASRGGHTTLPPSLQAKMAEVCIFLSLLLPIRIMSFRWQSGCHTRQMSTVLTLPSSASASVHPPLSCEHTLVARHSVLVQSSLQEWPLGETGLYLNLVTSPVSRNLVAAQQALVRPSASRTKQSGRLAVPGLCQALPLLTSARSCTLSYSSRVLPSSLLASDPSGALNFNGKAILHSSGVNFSNGSSFLINMDQLQLGEELGNGAYGTVKRVLHKPTNVVMAMKVGPLFNHDLFR